MGTKQNAIKSQILAAQDRKTETVHVPEWGMDVTVRGLTGTERDHFEDSMVRPGRGNNLKVTASNFRARFLVLCIIDDDGNRVFDDNEAPVLGMKSASAINRLYDVASRLSGMSDADEAELIEAFSSGQSDGSTSA